MRPRTIATRSKFGEMGPTETAFMRQRGLPPQADRDDFVICSSQIPLSPTISSLCRRFGEPSLPEKAQLALRKVKVQGTQARAPALPPEVHASKRQVGFFVQAPRVEG